MAENPKDVSTSTKCFSGIFQKLLCGASLPTHPSDEPTYEHSTAPFKAEPISKKVVTANSPGIVARLMGLDSLPEATPFPRSRSVNSLDYLMSFDLTEPFHRRVKTSVSFREIPNYDQEFIKSEFLVFCLEEEVSGSSIGKSNKVGNEEKKVKREKQASVAKSSSISSGQKKNVSRKQRARGAEHKQVKSEDYPRKLSVEKKKTNSKSKCVVSPKIQPLLNSPDSTPLHHLQQAATPKGKKQVNSRKSPAKVSNNEHAITINRAEKKKESNKETDYYVKVLGEICRLTEEELNKSYWIATKTNDNFNLQDLEALCLHFEQHIFQLLLDEVVHEL